MLNQVRRRSDGIVISRDGKPVAALVDAELFARIRRMRERFDALTARVAESYAEVPADVGLACCARRASRGHVPRVGSRSCAGVSLLQRLRVDHAGVEAAAGEQFVVVALLDDAAAGEGRRCGRRCACPTPTRAQRPRCRP